MDIGCSLYALIACFSWTNFYVDGGLSVQDSSPMHQEFRTHVTVSPSVIEAVTTQFTTDRPRNPYGRIAIGYKFDFGNVALAFEASHSSSFENRDDRGVNAIGIRARWYPFRN